MFVSSTLSKIESTMGDVDGNGKGKMKGTMKGVGAFAFHSRLKI